MGSNLGDREAHLRESIRQLGGVLSDLRIGPLYRTRPVASIPQPRFLNTAIVGACGLPAEALLAVVKELELRAGRRPGLRHGPRPLDIDLLVYGDRISGRPELTLPHPRLRQRRFVLEPLAAIAPDLPVPPDGTPVARLLEQVGQESWVERVEWARGGWPPPC